MSKIFVFLLLACVSVALAHPGYERVINGAPVLTRLVRAADPGYGGHHGGYHGHGGYGHGGGFSHGGGYGHGGGGYGHGGHGGYGGHHGGGSSFAQSSSNAAALNTPFGSAAIASSSSNAGGYGR